MTDTQQRAAAKEFVARWTGRGDEKQETQSFWIDLLSNVMGVAEPTAFINFEVPVKLSHTSFIDGLIPSTRVLIEQKGMDISLDKSQKQSDGSMLTPFGQARRYAGYLPHNENPRWIVVCNFQEFRIHDMNRPNDAPEIVLLSDLEKEYPRLRFLTDTGDEHIKKEMEVSIQAGDIVGLIYDAFHKQYAEPDSEETLKNLNKLCVRLVFCLYAEDAGIFGGKDMFHDYLEGFDARHTRSALIELFRVLNQDPEKGERDKYLDPELAAFPYVNGGLFEDDIEIPPLTDEIRELLLTKASSDFNWSDISPTIFGAVFESTLNPETRRSGGMHYTSIENIHKVIDLLFLDDLTAEYRAIVGEPVEKTRQKKLAAFQDKIASLSFLDPACGSGNFLTETYLSLRRLENDVLRSMSAQMTLGDVFDPIKVSIDHFYGIEINDFAVTVAKTALWIAESQMMKQTEDIIHTDLDFLPLTTNAYIVEGNALRMDWEDVVPKHELNYIMGNPPFVGYKLQTPEQKDDLRPLYGNTKNIDYVSGWYYKAAEIITGTKIAVAFVSTNSITQGEQVAGIWEIIFQRFNIHFDFAYRTFRWDSEASLKAHVHCVIIGFSSGAISKSRRLFTANQESCVSNINPYLVDAPNVFISRRMQALSPCEEMLTGSEPRDGGYLLVEAEILDEILEKHPETTYYIRRFITGEDFINNKVRYCLWLKNAPPDVLRKNEFIRGRLGQCQKFRENSKQAQAHKMSAYPALFVSERQPETDYLLIPQASSENRKYIPIGYMDKNIIVSNTCFTISNASLYSFGILTSNVHMAWMRTVCGRLKSDYRYSNTIVYNNFPWPTPTDEQKAKIEQTAQGILDARALYPNASLADLYDEVTMPPELRTAHQKNDVAVMQAYGFQRVGEDGKKHWLTEAETVAKLMKMYQQLTAEE